MSWLGTFSYLGIRAATEYLPTYRRILVPGIELVISELTTIPNIC